MLYKTFESKINEAGNVAGFFSTYDKVPDSYGDIIERGAFTKTIEKRKATGHPFPLCLNHDFDKVIGRVDNIEDQEKGPFYEASFYKSALAQDVREWTKDDGPIYQNSFAYDVIKRRDPTEEEKALGIKNVLQEVELYEISIVTVPANQNAVITSVKNVEPKTKAGRRNRKSDEDAIKEIIRLANSLLDDINDETPEETEEPKEEQKANEESDSKELDDLNARKDALLDFINKI